MSGKFQIIWYILCAWTGAALLVTLCAFFAEVKSPQRFLVETSLAILLPWLGWVGWLLVHQEVVP